MEEILLEAVDNLSKALWEVKTYTVEDMISRKQDLKAYTRYCFQAVDCLERVRGRAPFASKVVDAAMVERGIPIIDDKIKTIFKDVEDAARKLCKSSKGTALEDFGKLTYDATKGLKDISSPIAADRYLLEIVPLLKLHCKKFPKEAQEYLETLALLESQDTATLEQRFETLKLVLLTSLFIGAKAITNIYGDVHGHVLSGTFIHEVTLDSPIEKQKRDK